MPWTRGGPVDRAPPVLESLRAVLFGRPRPSALAPHKYRKENKADTLEVGGRLIVEVPRKLSYSTTLIIDGSR